MTNLEEFLEYLEEKPQKVEDVIDQINKLGEIDIQVERTAIKIGNILKGLLWYCKEIRCAIYPIKEEIQEEPVTFKNAYKCPDGAVKGNTKCYSKIGEKWRREPTREIIDKLNKLGCSHPNLEQIREIEKDASRLFEPCIYYDGKFIQKKYVVILYYLIECEHGPLWCFFGLFSLEKSVKKLKQTSELWEYIDSEWIVKPTGIVEKENCCKDLCKKYVAECGFKLENVLAEYRLNELIEDRKKKILELYKKGWDKDKIAKELGIPLEIVNETLEMSDRNGNEEWDNRVRMKNVWKSK